MQRLRRAVAVERVGRGVVHKVEDLLFVEEFHDRLGGVDVHVHMSAGSVTFSTQPGNLPFIRRFA